MSDINYENTFENMLYDGVHEEVRSVKKTYIPKRSYTNFLNRRYAIGALAFVVVIIIIIIVAVSIKKSSDQSQNSFNMILCNNGSLWNYNPQSNEISLLKKIKHNITSFSINCENEIFWIDKNTSKIYSTRLQDSDSAENIRLIYENPRITPEAFAIDHISNKLYIIDKALGILLIVDRQTNQESLALSDLENPQDILIDPATGHMFILQYSDSILATTMDATPEIKRLHGGDITAIALDYSTRKIFWITTPGTVQSSDYSGDNAALILRKQVQMSNLAISNNKLFWLSPLDDSAGSFLWTCTVENDNCNDFKIQSLPLRNTNLIKSFTNCANASHNNPCQYQNGGCEQICLLSTSKNGRHSCACRLGMRLSSNFRSCQNITEFVLYIKNGLVRGSLLNVQLESFQNTILPTPLRNLSLNNKDTIDFDYDLLGDNFYFSDDRNIYKINLKNYKDQTIVESCADTHVMEDIAFDWSSENLYYSKCSRTAKYDHKFNVISMKSSRRFQRTLMTFGYLENFGLNACPYATVIHSKLGYLFFSAGNSGGRKIYKLSLNGTQEKFDQPDETVLFEHYHKLLGLDYDKDLLYRISRIQPLLVEAVNMSGTKVFAYRSHPLGPLDRYNSIEVKGDYMYLSDENGVWRHDPDKSMRLLNYHHRLLPASYDVTNHKLSSIKIFDTARQSSYTNNPCAVKNGGCEQICFSGPVKSCGCSDGQRVGSNGRCS